MSHWYAQEVKLMFELLSTTIVFRWDKHQIYKIHTNRIQICAEGKTATSNNVVKIEG